MLRTLKQTPQKSFSFNKLSKRLLCPCSLQVWRNPLLITRQLHVYYRVKELCRKMQFGFLFVLSHNKSTSPPIPARPHPLRESYCDLLLAAQMPSFLLMLCIAHRASWIWSSLEGFVYASSKKINGHSFSIMCFSSASLVYNCQLTINLFFFAEVYFTTPYATKSIFTKTCSSLEVMTYRKCVTSDHLKE